MGVGGLPGPVRQLQVRVLPPVAALPRLTAASLHYLGAFRLPAGSPPNTFDYATGVLAFNPAGGTLFVGGFSQVNKLAEVSIPTPAQAASVAGLPRAKFVQPFGDPFGGKAPQIGGGSYVLGGALVDRGFLVTTAYLYYDGNGTQTLSHFKGPTQIQAPPIGPVQIGATKAGYVSGYLAAIPAAWQPLLGGPALTGNCCLPVISRTNYGAGCSAFDPRQIGAATPVPATQLLAQPGGHLTCAAWDANLSPSILFNANSRIGGVVFPEGSRSILFCGRQGTGPYGYGEGTSSPALAGQPVPGEPGVVYCYDPVQGSKGQHGYPYQPQIWAYDALDLAAVAAGVLQPWDPKPYAIWSPTLPFAPTTRMPDILGVAYDPTTQRLYLSLAFSDGDAPLVHVLQVVP